MSFKIFWIGIFFSFQHLIFKEGEKETSEILPLGMQTGITFLEGNLATHAQSSKMCIFLSGECMLSNIFKG